MNFQILFNHFKKSSTKSYAVGQRLKTKHSRNVIVLKGEVIISGIRHFSVAIESEPWRHTSLLSENALKDKKYTPLP